MPSIIVKKNNYQYTRPSPPDPEKKNRVSIGGDVCAIKLNTTTTTEYTLRQIMFAKIPPSGERVMYMRYDHKDHHLSEKDSPPLVYTNVYFIKIPIRNTTANTLPNESIQTMIADLTNPNNISASVNIPIQKIVDSLQKIARYSEYKDANGAETGVMIEYTPVFINIKDSKEGDVKDTIFKQIIQEPVIKGTSTQIANAQIFAEEQKQISCKQTTNSESKKNRPGRAILRVVAEDKTSLLVGTQKKIEEYKNITIAFLFFFFLAVVGVAYYIIYYKPNTMKNIRMANSITGGKSRGR